MLGHYFPVRPLRALSFLSVLVMASGLLPLQVDPGPDLLRFQGARPDSEQRAKQDRQALPADLKGILEVTRARLEELSEATAKVRADAEARQDVQRLKRENERLDAELRRGAEAERLKTELAEVKEQLSQATAAVSAMQRARQADRNEANKLRGEAERTRQELIATKAEIQRLMVANAELEKQVISQQMESISATEVAREIQKIAKLNADLFGGARAEGASPPSNPEVMPDPVESEEPAAAAVSSAMTQPPAPERAAETGAGQPTTNAPELPTAGPDEAIAETGSGLADFQASIQVLNGLERRATGVDLFSDIASVSGRAVHINATPAWDALPPVAKQTYLDALLEDWAATEGGNGPAVVRIVDPSGRVLIEKSYP
jgi:hypothetical protein